MKSENGNERSLPLCGESVSEIEIEIDNDCGNETAKDYENVKGRHLSFFCNWGKDCLDIITSLDTHTWTGSSCDTWDAT